MFEMNRVAAKIKEGRIRNNLTQNALAPFLSQQKLGALSQRVQPKSLRSLAGLGPYLSCTALEDLISRLEAVDSRDFSALTALAPFVSSKTLSDLVLRIREGGSSPNAGK